ncbi:MAG TPA: hypothetical protein VIQ54_29800 [Polyangia bacterium]
MSFEVYVQWFCDGEPDGVPEKRVRECFGAALKVEDEHGWRLSYGRGKTSDVYLSRRDDGAIDALTVHRPVVAPGLWQALFDLLGVQRAVFFYPDSGLFVRSRDAGAHLPSEMREALGRPKLVKTAADLVRAIDAAEVSRS